jgi:hypothetical protein
MSQVLADNLVFALNAKGHQVLQHRTEPLPTDIRFLMNLINGERSVQTLRVVSPTAKRDDSAFIVMLDLGLLDIVSGRLPAEFQQHNPYSQQVQAELNRTPNQDRIYQADSQNAFAAAQEPAFSASSNADILIGRVEPNIFIDTSIVEKPAAQPAPAPQAELVNPRDRAALESIIRNLLGTDAEPTIRELSEKVYRDDFAPVVVRIENSLREFVSGNEAAKLRAQLPAYFD